MSEFKKECQEIFKHVIGALQIPSAYKEHMLDKVDDLEVYEQDYVETHYDKRDDYCDMYMSLKRDFEIRVKQEVESRLHEEVIKLTSKEDTQHFYVGMRNTITKLKKENSELRAKVLDKSE